MRQSGSSFFLVIEGLDGSGKTRISRALARHFAASYDVKQTFEPHDPSAGGLFLRQVLTKRLAVSPRTLALAFALNRADHNDRVINPFLDEGPERILICDRYYLSSLVYQSVPPLTMESVLELNSGARQPDLILFLDASPQTCYERMAKRPADRELFEENLGRTRQKYHEAIQLLRDRGEQIAVIHADGEFDQVLSAALEAVAAHGPAWLPGHPINDTGPSRGLSFDVVAEAASRAGDIVRAMRDRWRTVITSGGLQSGDVKTQLADFARREFERLSPDELAMVFLGYLKKQGYQLGERLPWSDLPAYTVTYALPLGLSQRGTALVLPEAQSADLLTKRLQALLDASADPIDRISDFVLVLDTAEGRGIDTYEREAAFPRISPSVRVLTRDTLADFLIDETMQPQAGE